MTTWDAAITAAARLCDDHSEAYPDDIFPPGSAGYAVRWKCRQLANEIREMVSMPIEPPASSMDTTESKSSGT